MRRPAAPAGSANAASQQAAASPRDAGQDPERVPSRFASWLEGRALARERRRVEQGEVRRFTKRSRLARRVRLGVVTTVVVIVGGLVALGFSPAMSLKHIVVSGGNAAADELVRTRLEPQLGRPLPLVSLAAVDTAMKSIVTVQNYRTQLRPPSTLVVTIVPRTPLAAIQRGSSWAILDVTGVTIGTSKARPTTLPYVSYSTETADPEKSPGYLAAAAVLTALPAKLRASVYQVTADSADAVVLHVPAGKVYVFGGSDQLALKVSVLSSLLKAAPGAMIYDVSSPTAPVTR